MATVAASVSAGETVSPVLVSDPSVDPTENENLPGNTPLTEDEAAQLRELMSGPVETGTVPILQDVPGVPVLAKTGTAESSQKAKTWRTPGSWHSTAILLCPCSSTKASPARKQTGQC